jgi:uncharacterized membrane-anchored protein YhcB (DUF1043 family)
MSIFAISMFASYGLVVFAISSIYVQRVISEMNKSKNLEKEIQSIKNDLTYANAKIRNFIKKQGDLKCEPDGFINKYGKVYAVYTDTESVLVKDFTKVNTNPEVFNKLATNLVNELNEGLR